jgi:hypothetical protein
MIFTPKNAEIFNCETCHYTCSKKSDWSRHIITAKHKNRTILNAGDAEKFICKICKKIYKARNSLWYHEQKCKFIKEKEEEKYLETNINEKNNISNHTEISELKEFMNYLMKENSELKNTIMETIKNGTHNTTNMNSHNKSFNLNFFLNETCKNAMNITDFMNSIQLQLSDLESVGKEGFVNGISNIIVKNLKSLDITQRPVHCTDSKREVLYIKDENKWEKEGEENNKLRRAIKHVAYKNSKMLSAFREKHPDCNKSESKYSDQYNKLVIEAMGGKGDNDKEKEDKIIKNIAREVIVEK